MECVKDVFGNVGACQSCDDIVDVCDMVPDEVDMEHEVVKCGMCIVNKMNVV